MKKIIALLIGLILVFSVLGVSEKALFKQEKVKVVGLENAIMRVQNNETVIHLEIILTRITEKQGLQKLKHLEFREEENRVIAEGIKEEKFLGLFKFDRKEVYHISETGQIQRKNKVFDFLFSDVN